jgi:predicted Fe-Mo cluster-binding NifX family protein
MRVCIPSTTDAGLDGRLSPHFGRAPYFTIVDVESGRVRTVPNPHASHEPGTCEAVKVVDGRDVDVVVCRGMGPTALSALRSARVAVLGCNTWTVRDAVAALREGRLTPLTPEHAGRHAHN